MAARRLHLVSHHPGRRRPAIGRCPKALRRRPSAVGQSWVRLVLKEPEVGAVEDPGSAGGGGWSLGSPRDSPEPPLPPWTCPGTPARLAGSVCAASLWLEHYGEPGAPNGRNCSPLGPLRPWKKPLGGSWLWSWKMSWLPTWFPWCPKRRSPPHGTAATIRIPPEASHLPHHPDKPRGAHRPGPPTHCAYAESP